MKQKHKKKGFVALMSSIIISAMLLIIAVNTGFINFYNRTNILNSELKEISTSLADACLDIALLNLLQDSYYSGNINVPVGENSCYIGPVTVNGAQKMFYTKGVFRGAHTNLKITLDGTNLKVIAIEEIPTF